MSDQGEPDAANEAGEGAKGGEPLDRLLRRLGRFRNLFACAALVASACTVSGAVLASDAVARWLFIVVAAIFATFAAAARWFPKRTLGVFGLTVALCGIGLSIWPAAVTVQQHPQANALTGCASSSVSTPPPFYDGAAGAGGPGQIDGGAPLFSVEAREHDLSHSLVVSPGEQLTFVFFLYDPGPSFLDDVLVRAALPAPASTCWYVTGLAWSPEADPHTTQYAVVLNSAGGRAEQLRYVPGSTWIYGPRRRQNPLARLQDGVTEGGVWLPGPAAQLPSGSSGIRWVTFKVRVEAG